MRAVIMAGGEGSRLRPMTCTAPKPMAKILGKPIIEYVFDTLISGGVTHATITLGYLSHIIEENYETGYKRLELEFVREDEPLGTAGGVKNAITDFKEPFVVISADAMCNFDIRKITEYHREKNAMVTVVATETNEPCEYGVINIGKDSRVKGFAEKPPRNQAINGIVNTGVYIIDPECMKLVPNGKKFDFASDLFPLMLEKDLPIYCFETADYWCDVGNIEAYLKCQKDLFDGKMKAPVACSARGIYLKNKIPSGDYSIIPPVYIGSDTEISDGAEIGPYAVIDDNCYIGKNAKIRESVVLENSSLASCSCVTGGVVCSGAVLKKGAAMFEGSVAGSGSVIGEEACVKPNILVWPGKIISSGTVVSSNVKYGNLRSEIIGQNGVEEKNCVLNCETCVKLGYSVAASGNGNETAVGHDGSNKGKIMSLALSSGVADGGGRVWDFGECFEAQFNFLVNYCELDSGMFVSLQDDGARVSLCGNDGMSINRSFERAVENGMRRCEFRQVDETKVKGITNMSGVKNMYIKELVKQMKGSGFSATINCKNKMISEMMIKNFECFVSEETSTVFNIACSGTHVCAETVNAMYGFDKLTAICCLDEMRKGKDVAVPYTALFFLDSLAEKFSVKVHRYLSTPIADSDRIAREIAANQIFVRDALFLCVKLVSIMNERGMSLDELASELPEKYVETRSFSLDFSPTKLLSIFENDKVSSLREGIKLIRNEGELLVIPERGENKIKVLAQANTMEAAEELCADVEELMSSIDY